MTLLEVNRNLESSYWQLFKSILLDIVFAIVVIHMRDIRFVLIGISLLICTVVDTYHWFDYIIFMKKKKESLEVQD